MSALPPYVTAGTDAVFLDVFVQPRAAKDAIVGVHGEALKLKVRAVPEQGRANRAAEDLIAAALDIPRSDVGVRSGASSRHKRLRITGMSAEKVACELTTVLSSRAHEPGKEDLQQGERGQENGPEGREEGRLQG